jgi:hypothetical protein
MISMDGFMKFLKSEPLGGPSTSQASQSQAARAHPNARDLEILSNKKKNPPFFSSSSFSSFLFIYS